MTSHAQLLLSRSHVVYAFGLSEFGRLGLSQRAGGSGDGKAEAGREGGGGSLERRGDKPPRGSGSKSALSGKAAARAAGSRVEFRVCKPRRVSALDGMSIVQVAAGGCHSIAVGSEGSVFAWGKGAKFNAICLLCTKLSALYSILLHGTTSSHCTFCTAPSALHLLHCTIDPSPGTLRRLLWAARAW